MFSRIVNALLYTHARSATLKTRNFQREISLPTSTVNCDVLIHYTIMRDILKKLRCGGGSSAAKASESCEEPKDGRADEGQENGARGEQETEKLLVENGGTTKECTKEDEKNDEKTDDDKKEDDTNEEKNDSDKTNEKDEEKDKDEKEDKSEKETAGKPGVNDNCESIETVEAAEDAGEGENLIKKDEEKLKEKDGKKNKKKEGGGWMCGLGKKSSKEKSEKKKKEEKKGKKSKSPKVEEVEEEGLPENEKKLIDGEEDANEEVDKSEEKEGDVKEAENNESGKNNENGEKNEEKNEEVVVFVTESEAVVEETHHTEAATEINDECSVKGEGLVKGICGQEASFEIHVLSGDVFSFTCKIQDSNGNEVAAGIDQVEGNIHKATYQPSTAGIHTIEALWKGQSLTGSPFQAAIAEKEES